MNLEYSQEAEDDIDRIAEWWKAHRDVGAEVFFSELELAEDHLKGHPETGQPWRRRDGELIRRWLLKKTHYHIYYIHRPGENQVWVLTIWGAARKEPKL